MLRKILKKDLCRNRLITAILFLFITLAAMSAAGAAGLVLELTGAVQALFEKSEAPDFVQMYAGPLDRQAVTDFAAQTDLVKARQTVELLNVNGSCIFFGDSGRSQAGSVLENSFVVQNQDFDFLLGLDNQVLQAAPGQIGVPVYYMKENQLQTGDTVTVSKGDFQKTFTICGFVRDAQMNSSLVTSKRFLVNQADWDELQAHLGEREYLIEFQLTDPDALNEFIPLYESSGLPQTGTAITAPLYRLLNSLSDGITAAVIILISIMLTAISFVSLRFTLLSAAEEDYGEIGVMKAIGIGAGQIRSLYLVKYLAISAAACLLGYVLSLFLRDTFAGNITLYMGKAERTALDLLLPALAAALVLALVCCFCRAVLGSFKHISAVDALRGGVSLESGRRKKGLSLRKNAHTNVNLFLGWNELFVKFRTYGLLCTVFVICTFLMAVPLRFLSTLQSPAFITYMGAGESDIRIDVNAANDPERLFPSLLSQLESDSDITKYAVFATGSYKVLTDGGVLENMKIESGNFNTFPLEYSDGRGPQTGTEIALSAMNAAELGRKVGDALTVYTGEQAHVMQVCGIYQDITNGGITAKAMLPPDPENVLWYVVNLDVNDHADIAAKTGQYAAQFPFAKVTAMNDYVSQTFGSVLGGLKVVIRLALALSAAVSVLITGLFFKLLIAKETMQIAAMCQMGFSIGNIRLQYMTRALTAAAAGCMAGVLAAGLLGPHMAGLLLSGISGLRFTGSPLIPYIACPLLLLAGAWAAVTMNAKAVERAAAPATTNRRNIL